MANLVKPKLDIAISNLPRQNKIVSMEYLMAPETELELAPASLTIGPHRHEESFNEALAKLISISPLENNNWLFVDEKSKVRISIKPQLGMPLPFVRGDSLLKGNFTVHEVLGVIRSSFARTVCKSCLVRFPLLIVRGPTLRIFTSR